MSGPRATSIRIFLANGVPDGLRVVEPSTAAGMLVGGSADGRIAWKDEQGRTLKALQETRAKDAS